MKSLDFISWSDSREGIGELGMNTLFASNSSLISNESPMKVGEEIILEATIVGHRDTAGGGLTPEDRMSNWVTIEQQEVWPVS